MGYLKIYTVKAEAGTPIVPNVQYENCQAAFQGIEEVK